MKLLRIRAEGLPLYCEPFDISFFATQRVQNNHLNMVSNLFGNIYVNTVEAFIGINASGKTTALKVISFARMLLMAVPLNANKIPHIFSENVKTTFDIDFFADDQIFHLNSELVQTKDLDGHDFIRILSEKLYVKKVTSRVNKSNLLDFNPVQPVRIRSNADEYLSDDVSIMIAVNKQIKTKINFVDLAMFTDFNLFLPMQGTVPTEIISLLDPSVEHIILEKPNDKMVVRIKFFDREELILFNIGELNNFLSSGTIKGIRVFSDAAKVLKNGGYLIVDEIENHFNRELVAVLLRLFMNKRTNPKGAVIIFSTHYAELLDEIERNDAIFITRSDHGLHVTNLSELLNRNDLKKSEVYQSNFLGGTAPKYHTVAALREKMIKGLVE